MATRGKMPGVRDAGLPGEALLKVTLVEVLRSCKGNFIFFFLQKWKLSCQNIAADACQDEGQK